MRQAWKEILMAILLGVLVPALAVGAGWSLRDREPPAKPPAGTEETAGETEAGKETGTETETGAALSPPEEITIPVLQTDGQVCSMALSDYLTGVVLAEMPGDFALEAKKAQATVARTYTLRGLQGHSKHTGAAVCTDSTCCQAYLSPEEYLAAGGKAQAVDQARQAVADTRNQVLTYEGSLIEATYFSCSGGRTEDALAVWGSEIPYLHSVDSPGEEAATHYTDTVTFTPSEVAAALGTSLTGPPERWLGPATYTAGGGVKEMTIGGKTFSGTGIRQALGLRSTAFTMTVQGGRISVTTRGFGHRVGMSQYGADAMAVQGSTYGEILAHYYPGTVLWDYAIDKTGDLG